MCWGKYGCFNDPDVLKNWLKVKETWLHHIVPHAGSSVGTRLIIFAPVAVKMMADQGHAAAHVGAFRKVVFFNFMCEIISRSEGG